MATMQPEVDIAAALVAATSYFSPALVLGTSIKLGVPRATLSAGNETANIWVAPYGGEAPAPFLNAAVEGSDFKSDVQVTIRGAFDDYQNTIATARAVRAALHLKQTSGYISWKAKSSEPIYRGVNEADQHLFSVNITARWKAAE